MAKVAPFHSRKPNARNVYHVNDKYSEGNNIERENLASGTGGRAFERAGVSRWRRRQRKQCDPKPRAQAAIVSPRSHYLPAHGSARGSAS